ncbi:ribosomal protein S5 domain 2-type protein [Polychytrium aggregatum]|uniref:ribosomal protein S5 domain 2-type protein n=1 Tax=Polychytrium aggregatum TaxID=110093 RepID=UPI0022FDF1C7|nr:ribosomal protein S5 domain 2-type protein [Polychytrium aggregatum]KAI9208461.1 ribosomal protein S5 domain 2-type protein [Polychytrium aggregatum]
MVSTRSNPVASVVQSSEKASRKHKRTPPGLVVSAPGKVILFGEHAVVYGKTAIAASLGLRSYLYINERSDEKIRLHLPDLKLEEEWSRSDLVAIKALASKEGASTSEIDPTIRDEIAKLLTKVTDHNAIQAVLAFLYLFVFLSDERQEGIDIAFRSSLPVGAGLGSSASFSVCVSTALLLHYKHMQSFGDFKVKLSLDNRKVINDWAFLSEKILHGNPSGIDNALCTYGGAQMYTKGSMKVLDGFTSLRFLLTNTNHPKNTKVQVENVRLRKEKFPELMQHVIDAIQNVSDRFKSLFSAGNKDLTQAIFEDIEALIDMNHGLLVSAGVSHPTLELVRQITTGHGLHSKLTGAGGGGCALTLLRQDTPASKVTKVTKDLQKQGFSCFETSVGCQGATASFLDSEDWSSTDVDDFLNNKSWRQLETLL